MPWTARDATKHTKKAKTPAARAQWARVANKVLRETGDDGLAIREANGVVAKRGGSKKAKKAKKGRKR